VLLVSTLVLAVSCSWFGGNNPPPTPELPSDIYVSAAAGSDAAGDGREANPFKTITRALGWLCTLAGVEDDEPRPGARVTVHIAPGVYNRNLGEDEEVTLNNVALVGEGATREDVKLVVGIRMMSPSRVESVQCLGNIAVYGRELAGDTVGTGMAEFRDVVGGTITIEDFDRAFPVGVRIAECNLGGVTAFSYYGAMTISDCHIVGGGGLRLSSGGEATDTILVERCTITGCTVGVLAVASEVTLRDNQISDCFPGIELSSEVDYTMSGNDVRDCYFGIIVGGNTSGAVTSQGENTVTGSDKYNIADVRSPYSGGFSVQGITWNSPQPTGAIEGPADSPQNYMIEQEGNRLIFSD
jgi:hypothetical protein